MKGKMLQRMWLFAGVFVSLALVTAFAPSVIKAEAKAGFYQNKEVGVTLTWPADVLSVNDKLQKCGSGVEVVRAMHAQKVPVLTLSIADKAKDALPISDFEGISKSFKNILKKCQSANGSERFKLKESKLVTLANGTQAVYSMTTWKWGGTFGLVTTALTIYRGDKVITVSVTAPPGQPPVEVMDKWIMAVVVDP
ncbi:MAG: hypothetical protein HQ517_00330 [SAR324 cluster bacterium]|nr:hypothetical protein [SAR324 cluster bacterium]